MITVKRALNNLTVFRVDGKFDLFSAFGESNAQEIISLVKEKVLNDESLYGTGSTDVIINFNGENLKVVFHYSFFNLDSLGEKILWNQKELLSMVESEQDYPLDFDQGFAIYTDGDNKLHKMENILSEIPESEVEEAKQILENIEYLESLIIEE